MTCRHIPSSPAFHQVLTKFLEKEFKKLRITEAQMSQVDDVVSRLNNLLKKWMESQSEDLRKKLGGRFSKSISHSLFVTGVSRDTIKSHFF